MVLDENFKEFIRLLNANAVKYLVIGGYAVAKHAGFELTYWSMTSQLTFVAPIRWRL